LTVARGAELQSTSCIIIVEHDTVHLFFIIFR